MVATTFGWCKYSRPKKQKQYFDSGGRVVGLLLPQLVFVGLSACLPACLALFARREASTASRYVAEINDTLAKDPNKYVQFIKHLQYNLLPTEFMEADERGARVHWS